MRLISPCLVILITIFAYEQESLADLTDAPVISKSGHWSVRKEKDFMTDETSCVALYKDRFDIQLNLGRFFLDMSGKGGVKGFEYRIDEQNPQIGIPDKLHKETGIVELDGSNFQQLLSAKRIRIQVLTVLGDIVEEDIDLTGLAEIYPTLTGSMCE